MNLNGNNKKLMAMAFGMFAALVLVFAAVPGMDAATDAGTEDEKTTNFFDDLKEKWNSFISDNGFGTVLMLIFGIVAAVAFAITKDFNFLYVAAILIVASLVLIVGNIDGLIDVTAPTTPAPVK